MIFAPDHAAVAAELARVTRLGGRLAFSAWTPEGTVGGMFQRLASFQPPPPEGAGSPLQWGSEPYVRRLLGDAFELRVDRRVSPFEATMVGFLEENRQPDGSILDPREYLLVPGLRR